MIHEQRPNAPPFQPGGTNRPPDPPRQREPEQPSRDNGKATPRPSVDVGMLNPAAIEHAFIRTLQFVLGLLVVLSVIGTFYGMRGQVAPLSMQIVTDILAMPERFAWAFIVQAFLSIIQYGSRLMSRHNRRWWILYTLALSLSVMYNIEAYSPTLQGYLPDQLSQTTRQIVAFLFILGGDVVPELLAVRKRR